jgi:hypothetical protein
MKTTIETRLHQAGKIAVVAYVTIHLIITLGDNLVEHVMSWFH